MTCSIGAGRVSPKSLHRIPSLVSRIDSPLPGKAGGTIMSGGISDDYTEMLRSFFPLEVGRMFEVLWWFHTLISGLKPDPQACVV